MSLESTTPVEHTTPGGYLKEVLGLPPKESGDAKARPVKTALHAAATALFPITVAYNDQINRRGHEAPLGSGKYGAGAFALLTDFYVDLATLPFLPVLWPIKATANAIAPALGRGLARMTHGPLSVTSSEAVTSEPASTVDKPRPETSPAESIPRRMQPPRTVRARHI